MEINTWCSKHTNKQKTNTINQKSFCGRFSVLNFLPRGEKTSVIKHHTFIMNTDLIIARTHLYKGMCVYVQMCICGHIIMLHICAYMYTRVYKLEVDDQRLEIKCGEDEIFRTRIDRTWGPSRSLS